MLRSLVRPTVVGPLGWMAGGVVVGAFLAGAGLVAQAEPAKRAQASNPFVFMSDASLLINYVKPEATAAFEGVMAKVKDALAKSGSSERKAQAEGWKVFRTDLPGPDGAVTYFAIVDPVIKGNDYNMRTILTEAFGVEDTNTTYKTLADSVAGQQLVALTQRVSMR